MTDNPRSTARIGGHPIHPMLVPFPIACFVGTLITDLAYAATYDLLWSTFSIWLLTAGLIMALFAAIAGLIDFLSNPQIRALRPAWIHVVGNTVAVLLSLINAFIHSRDGYTAVVPLGLILSAIVVTILLVTGWMGWDMVYRHRVGVVE